MIRKKAQGMSVNVIIIAVLALLVLITLALIFSGKMKSIIPAFNQDKCELRGYCMIPPKDTCTGMKSLGFGCPKDVFCCIENKNENP